MGGGGITYWTDHIGNARHDGLHVSKERVPDALVGHLRPIVCVTNKKGTKKSQKRFPFTQGGRSDSSKPLFFAFHAALFFLLLLFSLSSSSASSSLLLFCYSSASAPSLHPLHPFSFALSMSSFSSAVSFLLLLLLLFSCFCILLT